MRVQLDFQTGLQSIERLLGEIESSSDPNLRVNVQQLVRLVMDLHGAGIEKMLEFITASPDRGENVLQRFKKDELVSSLLILYGLHPLNLEERVVAAVDKVRPKVRAHEGELELLGVENGRVRLRLQVNGHGCGSNGPALKEMVENALNQSAPDMEDLMIEGADEVPGFVPLEMLRPASVAHAIPGNQVAPARAFAVDEKGMR